MSRNIDDKVDHIQNKVEEVSTTVHKIDKDLALQKAAFDDHLDQDKRIFEEFKRMNDILQQNTDSLREHMRRTDILEDMAKKFDARFAPIELAHIEQKIINKYTTARKKKIRDRLVFITKIVGGTSAAIAIYLALKTFIGH